MKRILALLLVIFTVCFCLTSCNEDIIESLEKHKWEYNYHPEKVKDVTLEVYLICEEVSELSRETVVRQINQITTTDYKTTLNIHYVKADDYKTTVKNNIGSANLILINSKELMNDLVSDGKLAELSAFYATDTYGKLNVTIAESLLEAATDEEGKCYCVPNNHIITPYTFVKINIDTVHKTYHKGLAELRTVNTLEAVRELRDEIDASMNIYNESSPIYVYQGNIEDKVTEENGYVCNVLEYPTVDEDEVYSSAFAVVHHDSVDDERVFEIIYAINNDEELRNLLQYGVKGINYKYTEDTDDIERSDEYVYKMDLLYTGDLFLAHYCEELDYNKKVKENGILQNRESVSGTKKDFDFPE